MVYGRYFVLARALHYNGDGGNTAVTMGDLHHLNDFCDGDEHKKMVILTGMGMEIYFAGIVLNRDGWGQI